MECLTYVSSKELVTYHGFFFIELSLDNANRAGEIIHLTLSEFHKGSIKENGAIQLKIKQHKTYHIYDPSNITVNKDLAPLLRKYVKYIRPYIINQSSPVNMFLTKTGNQLSSSMRFHMQAVWHRIGLKSEVGPTLLRKTAVTAVHLSALNTKKALASKMNHSETTASRYYFTAYRESNSTKVSQKLRQIICNSKNRKDDRNEITVYDSLRDGWSQRNHFSKEQEEHLSVSCNELFVP